MTEIEQLRQKNSELEAELEKARESAKENAHYKDLIEGRVNRKAKDSVFINLFSYPEYQMLLYRELFPDDTGIEPGDLELFRVDSVLTNHPYNDLGILARRKLIVLAEAESQWSENIIFRLAEYYFKTARQFIDQTGMNVHRRAKIDLPDVEGFVIYPGKEEIKRDTISLRDVFFDGKSKKPDFHARIIHGTYKGGIIEEYMNFCRVFDEQRVKHKDDEVPEKWIAATAEICIEQGYLWKYLSDHRAEVEQIMLEMYKKSLDEAEKKSDIYEAEIAFGRALGATDEQIMEQLVARHGFPMQYAKNLLKTEKDKNTVIAM